MHLSDEKSRETSVEKTLTSDVQVPLFLIFCIFENCKFACQICRALHIWEVWFIKYAKLRIFANYKYAENSCIFENANMQEFTAQLRIQICNGKKLEICNGKRTANRTQHITSGEKNVLYTVSVANLSLWCVVYLSCCYRARYMDFRKSYIKLGKFLMSGKAI